MGFGIGSGWDGVSYSGIQDIVDKGSDAIPGVNQVFHGENAGEIDKFFGDTITRAIDFRHVTDPLYELAVGEHVHTPFAANASDDAFFITVQGFDYDDARWKVELVAPDGTTLTTDATAPVKLDMLKRNGRTSMMLKRNQASDAVWVGTWQVRTTRLGTHDEHGRSLDHASHEMFMPELWSLLRPQGAPRISGRLYPAAGVPRLPERFTPDRAALTRLKLKLVEVRLPPIFANVCAVAVNVSHRGQLRTTLKVPRARNVAGEAFDIGLLLEGIDFADLDDIVIAGRLVAPGFSIGNLLADVKSLPTSKRVLDPVTRAVDVHRFLIDLEEVAPHFLNVRDEEVSFVRDADGSFRARIKPTHPGVHYVSVYFEATDVRSPRRERVRRILTTEVPVGLALDPRRSAPKVTLVGNTSLRIALTPIDALGNIAAPARGKTPQVLLNGIPVEARPADGLTAERVLEVPVHAGRDHGFKAACCLRCADGTMLPFDPEHPVSVQVVWGGVVLAAGSPNLGPPPDHGGGHDHG